MTPRSRAAIAVLDYGIGNLRSAVKALQAVGADAHLVATPGGVTGAAGVVLPGVGAFGPCVAALTRTGLGDAALSAIEAGVPFLGICVGLQMLCTSSNEAPGVAGLGVLDTRVVPLPPGEKRPQMQWNCLGAWPPPAVPPAVVPAVARAVAPAVPPAVPPAPVPVEARMFPDGPGEEWMYFVHSFVPEITEGTVAVCDYGGPICAAIERDALWGTQFHPEKSGRAGLALLERFRILVEGRGAVAPRPA